LAMPNKHYFTVNLAKFPKVGSKTNNEVFLPGKVVLILNENIFFKKNLLQWTSLQG